MPLPPASPDVDAPVLAVLPPGWTVRPPRFDAAGAVEQADVEAAFDAVVRCEAGLAEGGESTRDEVSSMWSGPEGDRAGSRLVLDPAGRAAAVTLLEADPHGRTFFVDAYADPGHPGAPPDLLLAVARGGVARAREVAADAGGRWTLEAGSYAGDATYHAVLTALGLTVVRRFHRMRIDLADPPTVATPPGVTLENAESESQLRELHRVVQQAFADHWGHTARDFEAWLPVMSGLAGADPSRWWLVRVDGDPAAACINDDSRLESGDGYVRLLGVRREYRGRGLARWLLQRAFRDAADRGLTGVQLGVDAANETGATHLYESVGMRATRVMEAWRLALD